MDTENLNNTQHLTWEQVSLDFYPRLLAAARRLTRNAFNSQDLVHETFVRCLKSAREPEKIDAPLSYVLRTMRNVWIDHGRKYRKYEEVCLDDLVSNPSFQTKYLLVESNVLQKLETEELREELRMKSGTLSDYEKRLLELWLGAYTAAEIARELEEDVRIVRSDLNALLAKIRYRLLRKRRQAPGNVP